MKARTDETIGGRSSIVAASAQTEISFIEKV